MKLATRDDVRAMCAELSERLAESREAISARLDRAVRRLVLTVGALMVAAGAAVVVLTWSAA
jgi:hypothetical protein